MCKACGESAAVTTVTVRGRTAVTRGAVGGEREEEGREEQRDVVTAAERDQRGEAGVGYGEL